MRINTRRGKGTREQKPRSMKDRQLGLLARKSVHPHVYGEIAAKKVVAVDHVYIERRA